MAPSKAPTPRTSRNSRGLRNSPFVDRTPIVRRSSRRTPASTKVVESLTELPEPATPTPVARSVPKPALVESSTSQKEATSLEPVTLEPIQEEQPPKTPAAASPINPAQEQASTTPVSSHTPAGPSTYTPPTQRKVSPLQHRRIALIKGTPLKPVKKTGPVTPIYRPTRFLTRLVDRTPKPKPPPTPQSEGHETRRFAERRVQEDDDTEFARGIYLAIRNDHRMRECWCPVPTIYNSKEEAEGGSGHLRFYIDDTSGTKSLRVLQNKDDFNWHCHCAQEYHPVCSELLNKNGKRPAQDSELELIAQNSGAENSDSVKKVVSTPTESTTAEEKPEKESKSSMWTRARGLFNSVTTMINPFAALIGKIVGAVRGDTYETVDVRRTSEQDGTLVVKRFKRQLGGAEENELDGMDWVKNPTDYIGADRLERLASDFVAQATLIQEGKIVTGLAIKDIMQEQLAGQGVVGISVAIFKYQEMLFGPVTAEWTEVERAERFTEAVKRYIRNLLSTIEMMKNIYSRDNFDCLKQEHPKPKSHLGLGNNEFRLAARKAGEFLLFFQSLVDLIPMDVDMVKTIGQVIVDFDAVGKKELVPSLVAVAAAPYGTMPGFFPDEQPSVMEEVPIKDLHIQPLYEYRYPSPDPSESDSTPGEPGDYRLIAKPKGILKESKTTWTVPSTPKYVPTPQKSRKLVFESPISRFIAPSHIPSRIMTAREAELIIEAERKAELLGDEHSFKVLEATMTTNSRHNASQDQFRWSTRGPELEKDDREMGLSRYYQKYGKFLDQAREDLESRSERKKRRQEQEERSIYRMTPLKREIRIPRPPQFTTAERKRRAAAAAASMPSPEPQSPISFSPWYKRFTGWGYREETVESESEEEEEDDLYDGGLVMAKVARKPGDDWTFGALSDEEDSTPAWERPAVAPKTPPPARRKPKVQVIDLTSPPSAGRSPKVEVIDLTSPPSAGKSPKVQVIDLTSPPSAGRSPKVEVIDLTSPPPARRKRKADAVDSSSPRPPRPAPRYRELSAEENLQRAYNIERYNKLPTGVVPRDAANTLFTTGDDDFDYNMRGFSTPDGMSSPSEEQIRQHKEAMEEQERQEAEKKRKVAEKKKQKAAEKKKQKAEEERKKKEEEKRKREEEARIAAEKERQEREELDKDPARKERLVRAVPAFAPRRSLAPPLSKAWAATVDEMEKVQSDQPEANEIAAVIPSGEKLTKNQMYNQLLRPECYLNDQMIMGSLAHLQDRMNEILKGPEGQPRVACFDNFFWTTRVVEKTAFTERALKMTKKKYKVGPDNFDEFEYLLFPICVGNHWTLGVVRPALKVVYHLNSLEGVRWGTIGDLLYLADVLSGGQVKGREDEWMDLSKVVRSPQQEGGSDCGVCTIANAECVLNSVDPMKGWEPREMKAPKRRWIAAMLMSGGGYTSEFEIGDWRP